MLQNPDALCCIMPVPLDYLQFLFQKENTDDIEMWNVINV
jgi:hypothetical protein